MPYKDYVTLGVGHMWS